MALRATLVRTFIDPQFAANWKGMASHGVTRGAYQFFEPAQDPTAQAQAFLRTVGTLGAGDLRLVMRPVSGLRAMPAPR
jgi:GH25 family lysozyme M1 (1,4-beta-N-acetylmuramidase)